MLMLCSDGLYGVVIDEDICRAMFSRDPFDAAHTLIEIANVAGGPDNIAVAIARYQAD